MLIISGSGLGILSGLGSACLEVFMDFKTASLSTIALAADIPN